MFLLILTKTRLTETGVQGLWTRELYKHKTWDTCHEDEACLVGSLLVVQIVYILDNLFDQPRSLVAADCSYRVLVSYPLMPLNWTQKHVQCIEVIALPSQQEAVGHNVWAQLRFLSAPNPKRKRRTLKYVVNPKDITYVHQWTSRFGIIPFGKSSLH